MLMLLLTELVKHVELLALVGDGFGRFHEVSILQRLEGLGEGVLSGGAG